jgi:hypothetical protein
MKNIPTHDPYTGELNPYYEELTGKKNPQLKNMENKSTHYLDVAKWIEKVIDSCETHQQILTSNKLVNNFSNKLMVEKPDKYWNSYQYEVISPLENKLNSKKIEIKKIN